MAKHIVKYFVFLDSNAMLGRHWVKSSLFHQLDDIRKEQLADVKFFIPEIVHQEWSRHYIDAAQGHLSKVAGSARELERMKIKAVNVDKVLESDLQSRADAILKENSVYIVPTPYESIELKDLLDRAVRHAPPFDPESDKGIKDAIVAQTIYAYQQEHKARKSSRLVVITEDGVLTTYLQEIFPGDVVHIYGTLGDFESSLRLEVDKLSANLLALAKAAFYTPGDNGSLYYTAEVYKAFRDAYKKAYATQEPIDVHMRKLPADKIFGGYGKLPNDNSWEPLDSKVIISGTSFVKRERGRLHWSTSVTFKQAYALSTQNFDGMVFNNPAAVIHQVQFEINWSSLLRTGRTISSMKVESVMPVDESAIIDTFPSIDYEKGTSSLTQPIQPSFSNSLADATSGITAANAAAIASLTDSMKTTGASLDVFKNMPSIKMPQIRIPTISPTLPSLQTLMGSMNPRGLNSKGAGTITDKPESRDDSGVNLAKVDEDEPKTQNRA